MIRLHGTLADQFGPAFDLAVACPAEAVAALCSVVPGFLEVFRGARVHVLVGDEEQSIETVQHPSGAQDIHLVPVIEGAKDDLMQVVLGAALIAAAMWNPMGWAAIGTQGAFGLSALMGVGTSMVLGGVAQMLAGSPQVGGPDDVQNGSFFDGAENTIQQGACVPVGYGEVLVGSLVVSAGTTAEAYPSGANGGPFGANAGTWAKTGDVWSNGGDGRTVPLCLGVDL